MAELKTYFSKWPEGNMSLLNGNGLGAFVAREAIATDHGFSMILDKDGISRPNGFAPKLVHGNTALVIHEPDREKYKGIGIIDPSNIECDIIVIDIPNFPLILPGADCFWAVIWNPERAVATAAHSGRRGAYLNVAETAVQKICQETPCKLADCEALIFPGICSGCYHHKEFPIDIPAEYLRYVEETSLQLFSIDLKGILIHQLREAGIRKISFPLGEEECTCHSRGPSGNHEPKYFSHVGSRKKILGHIRSGGNNALFLEIV